MPWSEELAVKALTAVGGAGVFSVNVSAAALASVTPSRSRKATT